jgi:crossover junction endodeoxyribonuclease RusA
MTSFDVPGIPIPQGSKSRGAGGHMYEANKNLKPWREAVIHAARRAHQGPQILGPVRVTATFTFPRRKAHYRTGKRAAELRDDAPVQHSSKPDLDKLLRAIGDALTQSGVIRDDSQVASIEAVKVYSNDGRPEAAVTVEPVA